MNKTKKPVVIMYDSGIDEVERFAIKRAIEEVIDYFPKRGFVFSGTKVWADTNHHSSDWYLEKTKRICVGGKMLLSANHLMSLVANSEWQKENRPIVIFLVSEEMVGLEASSSLTCGLISIESVAKFRLLPHEERILAIKGMFHHELGHILGLAQDLERTNTEYSAGAHCTNLGCMMRYFENVNELVEMARESEHTGVYCRQCAKDARKSE